MHKSIDLEWLQSHVLRLYPEIHSTTRPKGPLNQLVSPAFAREGKFTMIFAILQKFTPSLSPRAALLAYSRGMGASLLTCRGRNLSPYKGL